MEKLVSRSSGGGAKLGTLDMQSYLEVMGRQLDEIQAQHQQFTASRQDRLGKLRSQEHPSHFVKRWSSESHGPMQQPGVLPPEYPPLVEYQMPGDPLQQGPPGLQGGAAVRSASASQSGARRSLLFGEDPLAGPKDGSAPSYSQDLSGVVSHISAVTAPDEHLGGDGPAGSISAQARAISPVRSVSESPGISASTSMGQSATPSATSIKARSDTPGTPSTHNARAAMPLGASRLGTASSSRTSSRRPYGVYDASGVGSAPYTTPDSHDGDIPLTASVSSSSQSVWQAARIVPAISGPSALWPASDVANSSPAVDDGSPQSGGHDDGGTEDDISPYTLALAGRAFDGIDSEEDDAEGEAQDDEPEQKPAPGSRNARDSGDCGASAAAVGSSGALRGSTPGLLPPDVDSSQLGVSDAPPHSRPGSRVPLVAASLETEEALRALLATPRFPMGLGGAVGASVDMEGIDVPDDVLAALAKTDGMDLDAALGAAMAPSLRESYGRAQVGATSGRPALQNQGGLAGLAGTGQGRHLLLGPGALTAVPLAVPAAVASRGLDASSTGGAHTRSTGTAVSASPCALPQRDDSMSQLQRADRPVLRVETSIEMDSVDVLSRTLEMSADDGLLAAPGVRDSVAFAKEAMAAQVAAAQQHSQPVLYSLAPKPGASVERTSRRSTVDGEGKRSTLEAAGRRNTVDGGGKRATMDGEPDPGVASMHLRQHAAAPQGTVATGLESGCSTARPADMKATGSTPSEGVSTAGRAVAQSPMVGRASEGAATVASPLRMLSSGAASLSPSASPAVLRHAGDVDTVLYGSPSQKTDAGTSVIAPASPYVLLPPQAAADQSANAPSPAVSQLGSRLQRNSRKMDEEAVAGEQRQSRSESGQAAADDAVAAAMAGTGQGVRLWSAAGVQNSSRRHLTPGGGSGSSSANNLHLDLSLTQAAAAAASGSSRSGVTGPHPPGSASGSAGPSPAISQRHLRTHGAQHLPALHKQTPEQQRGPSALEVPQQPIYSNFSLTAISPSGRPASLVASHDLGVDEVGRPLPPSSETQAWGTSAGADTSGLGRGGSRTSQTHVGSTGPPLAAFSRAAALAAAADVGMPVPPATQERRSACATTSAAVPEEAIAGRGSGVSCLRSQEAADVSGQAGPTLIAAQQHEVCRKGTAAAAPVDDAMGDRSGYAVHPELANGQSPGLPPYGSSAAKLSQLKARRQQQWQSQHGLQGSQPMLAVASTPLPQQAAEQHHGVPTLNACSSQPGGCLPGPSSDDRKDSRAPCGDIAAGSSVASCNLAGTPLPEAGSRSPLAAAVTSPLLPDAVAAAIARAAVTTEGSVVSGEINLGHGISGLSVAIEAGQVKWAWQTEGTEKAGPLQLDVAADASSSPRLESNNSSPWASPSVAHAAVRDSGTEWALGQLPAPQWQRYGQIPPAAHAQRQDQQQHPAEEKAPVVYKQSPGSNHLEARRWTEYSVPERQAAQEGGPLQLNYAVSAGGFLPQGQHQLRVGSATDGGGQPNSKAMALLRLKQQSIMRHNLPPNPSVKGLDDRFDVAQQPLQQAGSRFQAHQRAWASSAGAQQGAQQHQVLQQQQQQHQARQLSGSRTTNDDQQGYPVRTCPGEGKSQGGAEAGGPQAPPKPFLKRRSAKVQARKVDWSYVQPRTNSRNPDYFYGDQNSPEAAPKGRLSPISSPKGGISKPPLNVNVGSRAKKAGAKYPTSPTDEGKTPLAAPPRRRMSNIPPAPASNFPTTSAGGVAADRRAAVPAPKRSAAGGLSPLDDLLAHVNTLLRDFDKMEL